MTQTHTLVLGETPVTGSTGNYSIYLCMKIEEHVSAEQTGLRQNQTANKD